MAKKKNWWEDPEPAKRGSTAKFTSTGTQFPRFVQPSRTSSRVPGGRKPKRTPNRRVDPPKPPTERGIKVIHDKGKVGKPTYTVKPPTEHQKPLPTWTLPKTR